MRVANYTNQYSTNTPIPGAKNLLLDSIWPSSEHTDDDLQRAMIAACVSPMKPLDKLLTLHHNNSSPQAKALKYFRDDKDATGSTWHHGAQYSIAIKGSPATVLDHCSLSQTRREHLLLEATRRATHNREVIAIARGHVSTAPDTLAQVKQLDFIGFLLIKPVLS